ncbi:MAG: MFS transporter, partial [Ktedonobacterales bacterium]
MAFIQVGEGRRAQASHTRWNFTVLGADIAFFSLGLSISSAYTVLPLFVHHLTADNEAVALIPAVRALGMYAPPLLVAGLVERRRRAMPFILTATLLERLPFLALAICALWLTHANPAVLLTIFLLMILLATAGSGLTTPAWLDLVARAIPTERFGRFLGFWTGVGGIMGIGGAAIAAALIKNVRWPLSFALCFLLTFAAFVVSFVLLALGREPERTVRSVVREHEDRISGREMARRQRREIWAVLRADRGLQRLLATNGIAGVATMASALFAVAALRQGGLSVPQVGIESTVLLTATTVGNFLWGSIGDHLGHRTVLVWGSGCATAAALTALVAHGFWMYGLVFLLLGLN